MRSEYFDKQLKDYGFAPGFYQCQCRHCEQLFAGDKRAVVCRPCATQKQVAEFQKLAERARFVQSAARRDTRSFDLSEKMALETFRGDAPAYVLLLLEIIEEHRAEIAKLREIGAEVLEYLRDSGESAGTRDLIERTAKVIEG